MKRIATLLALPLLGCGASADTSANPEPTETATPGPTPDRGDGRDGPYSAVGTVTVNVCTLLTGVAGATLAVEDPAGLAPGKRLIAIQMQDELGVSGVTTAVTPGVAGQFELTRIVSLNGNAISVEPALAKTYSSTGARRAQVCTLPEYSDVIVPAGARIEAPLWNGNAGGFVGFLANGAVQIDGAISADARGFWGGTVGPNSGGQDVTLEDTANGQGGGKGEGIDGLSFTREGRGSMANGAGGGNAHNAGGGGGGNGGIGGFGGKQEAGSGDIADTAGRGGGELVKLDRVLFGGGGGGAGQQNGGNAGRGGFGGGLVFLSLGTLGGTGRISADGENGENAGDDGAGGGGAGGTIDVDVTTPSFTGVVSARGGIGGNTNAFRHGPGGGGGGGRARVPAGFAVDLSGGAGGVSNGTDPWGATAGGPGILVP